MTKNPSQVGPQTMKIDNPRVGDMHFDGPDRSIIVPVLGELQNHQFWSVFMGEKFSKKKHFFEVDFYMSLG